MDQHVLERWVQELKVQIRKAPAGRNSPDERFMSPTDQVREGGTCMQKAARERSQISLQESRKAGSVEERAFCIVTAEASADPLGELWSWVVLQRFP